MSVEKNYKAELVGVFGFPVSGNPTGFMQELAFNALNLNWRYLTIEVHPKDLEAAMKGVRAMNMKGVNLSNPHKVEVLKYVDDLTPEARIMGAVNIVYFEDGKLIGDNTDGKGFMTSFRTEAKINPRGKKIVVLGAGGAARAITVELALAGAAQITIVNRTYHKGKELTTLLNEKTQTKAFFVEWKENYEVPRETEILINATSIGASTEPFEKPDVVYDTITAGMIVCDAIHKPETPFLSEAKKRGAMTVDGMGALVNQGAISFNKWTGVNAPVEVLRAALLAACS